MRVIHVITGMRKAAGTTTFVENVVEGLRLCGHDVGIAMSPSEIGLCDIMHIHGLWSGLLHKSAAFARQNKIPVVWSTHGMTAPWSMRHKWWKKLLAWWLYQKRDLNRATAIHCTTDQEVEWNKSLGFKSCFVAPLGTYLQSSHSQTPTPTRDSNNIHTLLFVGRIYPVKGLVNLIRAWSLVQDSTRSTCSTRPQIQWKLRIVGPDQAGHLACLKSEVRGLNLESSVEFPGPKFGEELSQEYDNCDCLVLPSFTENFGATVVDAMAHGKPCIASIFTPWKELEDGGCGWWVGNKPESLAKAIREMIETGDIARCEMGERARRLVEMKYTWSAVVKKMTGLYEMILATGGGRK